MYWFLRLTIILATAVLAVSFLPTLFGRFPYPNPILIGVVVASLLGRSALAMAWALVGGLTLDLFVPGRDVYTLTFVLTAIVLGWLRERLGHTPNWQVAAITILLASALLPLIEMWRAGASWSLTLLGSILANLIGLAVALGIAYTRRIV